METEEQFASYFHERLAEFKRMATYKIPATGEMCHVRKGSSTVRMARGHVLHTLRMACPRGLTYLYHHLRVLLISTDDFEDACDRFGLRGVLREITPEDVEAEVSARRERGDPPSTGPLPMFLDEAMPREEADARIAIVERRIAEARAPGIPAPGAA